MQSTDPRFAQHYQIHTLHPKYTCMPISTYSTYMSFLDIQARDGNAVCVALSGQEGKYVIIKLLEGNVSNVKYDVRNNDLSECCS